MQSLSGLTPSVTYHRMTPAGVRIICQCHALQEWEHSAGRLDTGQVATPLDTTLDKRVVCFALGWRVFGKDMARVQATEARGPQAGTQIKHESDLQVCKSSQNRASPAVFRRDARNAHAETKPRRESGFRRGATGTTRWR